MARDMAGETDTERLMQSFSNSLQIEITMGWEREREKECPERYSRERTGAEVEVGGRGGEGGDSEEEEGREERRTTAGRGRQRRGWVTSWNAMLTVSSALSLTARRTEGGCFRCFSRSCSQSLAQAG